MPIKSLPSRWWPIALLLTLFLSACGHPPVSAPPVESARVPPLPAVARQPSLPTFCYPSCLRSLTVERESWLNMLTPPAPPDSPASGPMTH